MSDLTEKERLEGEIRLLLFKRFMWASPGDWVVAHIMMGRLIFGAGFLAAVVLAAVCLALPSIWIGIGAVVATLLAASGWFHAAYHRRKLRRIVPGARVPDDIQEPFNAALAAEVSRRYRRLTGAG